MQILNFIGRGSAFNTQEGNTSSYIKQEKNMLLLDCGENIFTRIMEKGLMENIKNMYVLITHLHPDHVGSLGTLIFYCYYIKKIKVNLIYEKEYELVKMLQLQGAANFLYNIRKAEETEGLESLDILQLKPFKMEHASEIDSFGYHIEFKDNKKVFYAGDTNNLRTELIEKLESCYYDQFYVDTCLADYPGNTHLSLNRICSLISKEYRSKVFCMHLDCHELIEKAKEEGFNVVEVL
ncbi:MBL fold metallo-hydrolase [Clostridium sp. CX1]|uniref:MBL fold metallo-hydrolase n=1 Tax=Clostridium tanneri TaxID=3037988 RepID=A0ABU4JT67_9CLOT|nr:MULTISPECIES: MBL fold metallo-hydrolase [unclassified Clostridium]MCT8975422.1 MBL fold metallo-hydrolase [Clostridium sp. CX1]MDW8801347.1 MBL fold metallo-hydrolase [Clostridium sp. A1-XYC3]